VQRDIDCWFREIQPRDGGTTLRQDQRLTSEMALQVKCPLSGDRAESACYDAAELALFRAQVVKPIATRHSM
jgi:hypothetical protein